MVGPEQLWTACATSLRAQVSDAAWLWMEFLSQPDNLANWTYKTEGTLLPPTKSLLGGADLAKEKPVLKPFADLMSCGVARYTAT